MNKLLLVFLALVSTNATAQKIDQQDLYQTWVIDKYSDDEAYYAPPKKELQDYISLKPDGTFVAVSEGRNSSGSWIFNANGKYVELIDHKGEKEKFYIHWLSNMSMVGTYDTDEYRIWEVHYVSAN